jgi:hypothetical protein
LRQSFFGANSFITEFEENMLKSYILDAQAVESLIPKIDIMEAMRRMFAALAMATRRSRRKHLPYSQRTRVISLPIWGLMQVPTYLV